MFLEFSNPEVAAKYEPTFGIDKHITIQKVYWGLLSNITPAAAERLIKTKDNQIRLKPVTEASIIVSPAIEEPVSVADEYSKPDEELNP